MSAARGGAKSFWTSWRHLSALTCCRHSRYSHSFCISCSRRRCCSALAFCSSSASWCSNSERRIRRTAFTSTKTAWSRSNGAPAAARRSHSAATVRRKDFPVVSSATIEQRSRCSAWAAAEVSSRQHRSASSRFARRSSRRCARRGSHSAARHCSSCSRCAAASEALAPSRTFASAAHSDRARASCASSPVSSVTCAGRPASSAAAAAAATASSTRHCLSWAFRCLTCSRHSCSGSVGFSAAARRGRRRSVGAVAGGSTAVSFPISAPPARISSNFFVVSTIKPWRN
mmetsp:Transcript_40444/g.129911  ORF Transcript_40444/g.129911 Transcript_40444/m.129911 type:complete len:287 (-) Transcript_40444:214-1074(-)